MDLIDVAMLALLVSVAYLAGHCMRGLFWDPSEHDWPAAGTHSDRYQPPRSNERT